MGFARLTPSDGRFSAFRRGISVAEARGGRLGRFYWYAVFEQSDSLAAARAKLEIGHELLTAGGAEGRFGDGRFLVDRLRDVLEAWRGRDRWRFIMKRGLE